jgi:hypothetical protein
MDRDTHFTHRFPAMMISRRFKAGCLMTLLIGFCLGIGFVFGILAQQAWKKKTEDPVFMKWAAMKQLEKLKPDEAQRQKFEQKTDKAVAEMMTFKGQAMHNIWDIIDRTCTELEQDITTAQKDVWSHIKPQRPKNSQ